MWTQSPPTIAGDYWWAAEIGGRAHRVLTFYDDAGELALAAGSPSPFVGGKRNRLRPDEVGGWWSPDLPPPWNL